MVKSKSSSLAKLPKEQRCEFLIGPSYSWFFPSNTDIWTQPKGLMMTNENQDDKMVCDDNEENSSLSYFIYGSIGCFCYGEIHHYSGQRTTNNGEFTSKADLSNSISATLNRLIDVKEDNSRVNCTRFLKPSRRPLALVLTDNGSILIHDCITDENLVHFKKSELIAKFSSEPEMCYEETMGEHSNKKARFDAPQQFSSCLWPSVQNVFLGVSLKKKTNLVFWMKLKDLSKVNDLETIQKNDIIESYEKLELLGSKKPICCMESALINPITCLIAVAMEDGLIIVININFELGKTERVISLNRHKVSVSSISFLVDTNIRTKYPLGLLASASRDGYVFVWDIDDEEDFAYYMESQKINWFALKLIPPKNSEHIHLAVSNSNSNLTILKLPKEKPSHDIILKETKEKDQKKQNGAQQTLRHHTLIFNIVFDQLTQTIMTTSFDGSIIFWKCHHPELTGCATSAEATSLELKAKYLYPTMSDSSRTHMLRHSPIRTDLVSLAIGKGGVKFYKISENHMNYRFDMNANYSEIARRISKASLSPASIAWHPNHEYRLAIGTLEGKVLRVDLTPRRATLVESESKKLNRFRYSEAKQASEDIFGVEYEPLEREVNSKEPNKTDGIYSICWGPNPCCPQDISKMAIYAIGSLSHRLFIYENYTNKKDSGDDKEKLKDYLDEFLDQSLPEAIGEASEVAWKSSMDMMALGTTTGKIIVVSYLDESHAERSRNNLFKKLTVIQGPLGNTYIQCLAWHPTSKEDDQHYYYIAASANESPVYVFNIKESLLVADVKTRLRIHEGNTCDTQNNHTTSTNIVSSYCYKLDGHKKPVSDVAWSPHKLNELATSSFDRNCFVWSLDESLSESSARISCKFAARHRLFTVEWSLIDKDLLFTSGQDGTIWAWRPSENRNKNEIS